MNFSSLSLFHAEDISFKESGDNRYSYLGHRNCVAGKFKYNK
jgi:hypothetical protein